MYTEFLSDTNEAKLNLWKDFLKKSGLTPENTDCRTVVIYDGNRIIASGSREANVLKYIAVDDSYRGEGLTSSVVGALKNDAFCAGIRHLFLYTKPQNKAMFSDLFFYTVAETDDVLLMEDKRGGITNYLSAYPKENTNGTTGCIIMNCNPFTLGHQYLAQKAADECDLVYIFAVSEDRSLFSADERLEMIQKGTQHIPNVRVIPTGPYLISSATFPTYFLKDRESISEIKCKLDIEIFVKYYVPHFGINVRYVGEEPFCIATRQYNCELKKLLPANGVDLKIIPRFEVLGQAVSASHVRELIASRDTDKIRHYVPDSTYEFLVM